MNLIQQHEENDGASNGKGWLRLKVKNQFEKPNSAPVPITSAQKNWPLQNKCPLDIQTPAEKVLGPPKHTKQTPSEDVFGCLGVYPTTYQMAKNQKKTHGSNHPKKLHPYGQGAIQHDPLGMCIRDLSQITHHLEPAWELGKSSRCRGETKNEKKCSENKRLKDFLEWKVLW